MFFHVYCVLPAAVVALFVVTGLLMIGGASLSKLLTVKHCVEPAILCHLEDLYEFPSAVVLF